MKHVFLIAAVLLGTNVSYAGTYCTLNGASKSQDMVFDQMLFSGEITTDKMFLLSKDVVSAKEIQLQQLTDLEQWKSVDGQTIVTFSPQGKGSYAIHVAQIDLLKSQTNMLPVKAIVLGNVDQQKPLSLMLPTLSIAATCFTP